MRELKFRAWAGDRNTMYQDVGYIHHKVGFSILPKDSQGDDIGSMDSRSHKISIMQYTGLKDKNGVEIYEGDILEDYDNQYIGVVSFEKGAFIVTWEGECCNAFEWSGEAVVGNIYEHTHLLEHL